MYPLAGIIIAAAFLTDPNLGLVTALAIIAHEIPQEVGDYIVLLNAGVALYAANVAPTMAEGIALARQALQSGAAKAKLDQLVTVAHALSQPA